MAKEQGRALPIVEGIGLSKEHIDCILNDAQVSLESGLDRLVADKSEGLRIRSRVSSPVDLVPNEVDVFAIHSFEVIRQARGLLASTLGEAVGTRRGFRSNERQLIEGLLDEFSRKYTSRPAAERLFARAFDAVTLQNRVDAQETFCQCLADFDASPLGARYSAPQLRSAVARYGAGLGYGDTEESTRVVRPFPLLDGSTWADVTIRFTGDFQTQIRIRHLTEVRTYTEVGFEDRRGKHTSKPDRNWEVLRKFAELDGAIRFTKEAADWPKLEKAVQAINKRLKGLFGLPDRAIIYDRKAKAYKTKFKVMPPPGGGGLE